MIANYRHKQELSSFHGNWAVYVLGGPETFRGAKRGEAGPADDDEEARTTSRGNHLYGSKTAGSKREKTRYINSNQNLTLLACRAYSRDLRLRLAEIKLYEQDSGFEFISVSWRRN